MNKEKIENQLRTWFEQMIDKYSWLSIKFEFSNIRDVYMVSFAPIDRIKDSDEFNDDVICFSNKMNDEFGIDAPLFTDEEELFKLSDNAEVMQNSYLKVNSSVGLLITPTYYWASSIKPPIYTQSPESFHTLYSEIENQYIKVA